LNARKQKEIREPKKEQQTDCDDDDDDDYGDHEFQIDELPLPLL
jgi:hypothetical protein